MINMISLFSGLGAFESALNNLKVEYSVTNYCELDKVAAKAYSLLHNISETKNLGDIAKADETILSEDVDLITYGFPCQDISLAGSQKGLFNQDGTKTRSGLFYEALRIISHVRPKMAIAENVKNLMGKKFEDQFKDILFNLEEIGYNNYYQILDAKDYGIPQDGKRIFIVSIRKDIDLKTFVFPEPIELNITLQDMLDNEIDEPYYVPQAKIDKILHSHFNQERTMIQRGDICQTLLARDYKDPKCVVVQGKVRRISPREYFRLMGFSDMNFELLVKNGISNTQLYKMAGNSIVVNVIQKILYQLFK